MSQKSASDAVLNRKAPGWTEGPEATFVRNLKERGLKYTAERREILKAVLSTHEHFDADSLFIQMRKAGAEVSKATIYRSLTLLCQGGVLREVFHGSHGASYEHVYGHEHHEHLICLTCGNVTEFISPEIEKLQEEACKAANFTPVRHQLQVFGYCRHCRKVTSEA
ncbi:MAG TPA: transcriptional repressor [Planctomycetota bacterium]